MVVAVRRPVRLLVIPMLLATSTAAAQPADDLPPGATGVADEPGEPGPAGEPDPSGEPASATPPGRQPGDELPHGAWPGVSLEDLRGLRECTLDDPLFVVGQPVTCRPPIVETPAHVSFDVAWVTGLAFDGGEINGVHGIAFDGEYWLTRAIGLGVRYQFAGIGAATPMGELPRAARVGQVLGQLHYRAFTDETDRDALVVTLGGGYATRDTRLGGDGPLARLAVSRAIGYMPGETSALTWAWELAAEQAFGDATIRTLTASVRAGFELGIRQPENLDEPDRDPPLRYAIGGEFRGSNQVGLGASLGLPFGERFAWRTTAFWTTGRDEDGLHGLRATWAAVTGPRVLLTSGLFAPYVDVQGGPAAIGGDPGVSLGWLAEAEAGIDIHIGCQTRLDLGGRIQARLDDGFGVRAGFAVLRVEHGPALRKGRGSCPRDVPIAR
jgi:hypothetical protein